MTDSQSRLVLWARWLAFASSVSIVIGIAPSQILLGAALAMLLASRTSLRLPPIKLPLGLFLLGTLIAVAFSGDPMAGFPQVKKIYVFSQLLVAYTLLRETKLARWLVLAWAGCGAASASFGLVQFGIKLYRIHQLHLPFYATYMERRITGFMSHWYTFSVEEMLVLMMLGSFLLFSPTARRHTWLWLGLAVLMGLGVFACRDSSCLDSHHRRCHLPDLVLAPLADLSCTGIAGRRPVHRAVHDPRACRLHCPTWP